MTTEKVDSQDLKFLKCKGNFVDWLNRDRQEGKEFTDIQIRSENKIFHVHKSFLSFKSIYFKSLFTTEMKEKFSETVDIGMKANRLERIIDYCYTNVVDICKDSVLEILEDAEYTQLGDLVDICKVFILQNVDIDNCLKLHAYAKQYNLDEVVQKTNALIDSNLEDILKSDDFKQLYFDDVITITKRVNSVHPNLLFTGIVNWVNHNPGDRKSLFEQLFSCLDISKFSYDFLQSSVTTNELVRGSTKCCIAIMDALAFSSLSTKKSTTGVETGIALIGGDHSNGSCFTYDVTTGHRESLPPLTTNRGAASIVKINTKIFVLGGWNSATLSSCEVFNSSTRAPWAPVADMPIARYYAASAVLDGLIYVTGGLDKNKKILSSCHVYSPIENQWKDGVHMLRERNCHAAVSLNNIIYCIGGWNGKSGLRSCEKFSGGKWSEIAPLNKVRHGLSAVVLDQHIYAIGGIPDLTTVEVYVPKLNKWVEMKSLNLGREHVKACVCQDKIYVVGGKDTNSVEVYNIKDDTWTICEHIEVEFHQQCTIVAI